jgi:hypothetical protein
MRPIMIAEAAARPRDDAPGRRWASLGVSAVVVNHNGGDRVLRALRELFEQSYPLAQVVVVDNASTDGSSAARSGSP